MHIMDTVEMHKLFMHSIKLGVAYVNKNKLPCIEFLDISHSSWVRMEFIGNIMVNSSMSILWLDQAHTKLMIS